MDEADPFEFAISRKESLNSNFGPGSKMEDSVGQDFQDMPPVIDFDNLESNPGSPIAQLTGSSLHPGRAFKMPRTSSELQGVQGAANWMNTLKEQHKKFNFSNETPLMMPKINGNRKV
jgi:hypothetical protein